LPKDPKGRARVRGLAQIVAADSHPLIVPRVREYLAHEYKFDEATVTKWAQHWHRAALTGLETHLQDKATGQYAHGDQITIADICLASQAAGAGFFKVDLGPFPAFKRVVDNCMQNEAFARAHPLKQPGAPASV
jgi:maleylacetoacetate isomerase